ncbi:MAG: PQQ-like beta-propeller repeat protein [Verrucomicrobia bacterium]|nr:PQQ-like beta-propeller repeat protein [Verrucomicrobiota bacterium]
MKSKFLFVSIVLLFIVQVVLAANKAADGKAFWPQWRGPLATGVAPLADPPLEWSESKNVKWKVKIPGFGDSTPIVWGERVFILSAVPTGKKAEAKNAEVATPSSANSVPREGGQGRGGGRGGFGSQTPTEAYQFAVLCLDRNTGKTLWQKVAREEVPHEGHQQNNTFASASPITDGQFVFAFFGSRGLYCYDMDGNLKWQKDFGHMRTKMTFGEGASPALYGDMVIVNWDHEGDDFITALDKRTGKELWRTPRDEGTGWSTPLVVEQGGKRQVVVNATGKVRSYDMATGKLLWECSGQTVNAIPSPVADADTVYVTSGFRGSALFAFRLDRTGDLAGTDAIRWSHKGNTPYVPSPLLVDDLLYFVANNDGKLSCFDAKTGKANFEGERLEGAFGIYASPVAAKDRVYVLGREGTCLVLKKGPKLEVLATNKLDDKTDASLALVGKELFVRGQQNLYCIAAQ